MREQGTRRIYRIEAESELGERFASAFERMRMESKDGRTILTGEVRDQPHLFGILQRLNGLGLKLLSVQAMPDEDHSSFERDQGP
jgi:outer membrane PBP1 activator LpoA protein